MLLSCQSLLSEMFDEEEDDVFFGTPLPEEKLKRANASRRRTLMELPQPVAARIDSLLTTQSSGKGLEKKVVSFQIAELPAAQECYCEEGGPVAGRVVAVSGEECARACLVVVNDERRRGAVRDRASRFAELLKERAQLIAGF